MEHNFTYSPSLPAGHFGNAITLYDDTQCSCGLTLRDVRKNLSDAHANLDNSSVSWAMLHQIEVLQKQVAALTMKVVQHDEDLEDCIRRTPK